MAWPGVVFRALAAVGACTLVAVLAVPAGSCRGYTRQRWHAVPGPEVLPNVHLFLNAPPLLAPDQLMFRNQGPNGAGLAPGIPTLAARAQYVDQELLREHHWQRLQRDRQAPHREPDDNVVSVAPCCIHPHDRGRGLSATNFCKTGTCDR
jgi:hypothetical protein